MGILKGVSLRNHPSPTLGRRTPIGPALHSCPSASHHHIRIPTRAPSLVAMRRFG